MPNTEGHQWAFTEGDIWHRSVDRRVVLKFVHEYRSCPFTFSWDDPCTLIMLSYINSCPIILICINPCTLTILSYINSFTFLLSCINPCTLTMVFYINSCPIILYCHVLTLANPIFLSFQVMCLGASLDHGPFWCRIN